MERGLSLTAFPGGITLLTSALLTKLGVPHAFTIRAGGVSRGPFESLNLGNPSDVSTQDSKSNIFENYRRVQEALGIAARTRLWSHQVHGAECHVVDPSGKHDSGIRCDALITGSADCAVSIRVADCVPLLMSSRDGSVVAAVHAGWRGVVLGIVPATLQKLASPGTPARTQPGDLFVAIGPHISVNSFEVGEEVAVQFESQFDDSKIVRRNLGQKPHIDLQRALVAQLLKSGVPDDQIDTCDLCTFERADLFFSHRRERGVTGRMSAIISPLPNR